MLSSFSVSNIMQTVTLAEITPKDITPEIYHPLRDFENDNFQHGQVADSALKMSTESLLMEDKDVSPGPTA